MDRQTLTALLLVLGVFYVWNWDRTQRAREAAALAQANTPIEAVAEVEDAPAPPAPAAPSLATPSRSLAFEGCGAAASFSTDGGVLRDVVLKNQPGHAEPVPVWRWAMQGFPEGWQPYGPDPGPERLATPAAAWLAMGSGGLTTASPSVAVLDESPAHIVAEGRTADGVTVRRELRVTQDDPCTIEVVATWRNDGGVRYTGPLWVGFHDVMPPNPGYYDNVLRPYLYVDGDVEVWGNLTKLTEPTLYEGPVRWVTLNDRYFAATLLLAEENAFKAYFSPVEAGEATLYGAHLALDGTLAPGESHTERMRLVLGPKELGFLGAVDDSLPALVKYEYGWFGAVALPLLWLLRFLYSIVGVWGLAIISLTVLMKTLFFPLSQSAGKSSQAMAALQPKLAALRETLHDQPEELNRQTMELFRTAGVNPVGGCLPMLVQMPVWFALYRVLPTAVELYHTEFLYLKDLSAPDPYGVLPTVVIALMWLQQQMMPMGNMDPAQARMLKIMPIAFGFLFFTFPSGLMVYMFVNTLLTMLQQWLIKRMYATPAPAGAGATA